MAADLAVGACPSAEGPLRPFLQAGLTQTPAPEHASRAEWCCFCLASRFSAKRRRCLWLMDLLADPVSSFRGGLGSWVWGADKWAAR